MIIIDKQSAVPVYEQVITQFEKLIVMGVLGEGEQIPSVRTLATELAVNPNTIQKAYLELENAGITRSSAGIGRFVNEGAKARIEMRGMASLDELSQSVQRFYDRGIDKQTVLDIVNRIYGG